MKILVIAALPQEYAHLKKLTPAWRPLTKRPFRRFAFDVSDAEVILLECGMGGEAAIRALEAELLQLRPALIVFAGFAGGLHPDLSAGEVCVVHRAKELSSETIFSFEFSGGFSEFLAKHGVRSVFALTAQKPENKHALSSSVEELAVLDMETAVVAETACRESIPFICFRAISDTIEDDLGFDLGEITKHGRVSVPRVMLTILRKPATLGAFYLSWRRSAKAGRNLCMVLAAFLRIPADRLTGISGELGLGCD